MSGIVLYGPPTAGKDTVTAALCSAESRFRLVTKLKLGTGRSAGYRFVTAEELDDLRRRGRIVVETLRYGNVYAVDHLSVTQPQAQGLVPVTHIGNATDMRTLLGRTPEASWYGAAKASEIYLAGALCQELAPYGVRVNTVSPGSILLPGKSWDRLRLRDPETYEAYAERNPNGRLLHAEEVAQVIAFLLSPASAAVNGAHIPVDGGQPQAGLGPAPRTQGL